MNNFDNSSISPDVLKQFRNDNQKQSGGEGAGKRADELGRSEFLDLMIAQMQNQDPLQPQKNGDFIAQLAQFSSLEQTEQLRSTVEDAVGQFRSTQALQASAMVGQTVLVEGNRARLGPEGELSGAVELPAATSDLNVAIEKPSGERVRTLNLGQQGEGQVNFTWDGENEDGELMPPGEFRVRAEAQFDGESQEVTTQVNANVDSVSLNDGGVTLNLAGRGEVPLNEVRQIK